MSILGRVMAQDFRLRIAQKAMILHNFGVHDFLNKGPLGSSESGGSQDSRVEPAQGVSKSQRPHHICSLLRSSDLMLIII